MQPKFIVLDEPVSAFDVSIQAQVLNLLREWQKEFDLTYLFVAHNLAVVEHISDRVAVMYLGKIVERADRVDFFNIPLHPYTQALKSAIPIPDPTIKRERIMLEEDVPSPLNPPPGCRFHPRCPIEKDNFAVDEPELRELRPGHTVACHYAEEFIPLQIYTFMHGSTCAQWNQIADRMGRLQNSSLKVFQAWDYLIPKHANASY